jgi:hypothetical protein
MPRGQTGLPANFRQKAPEIHGSLVSPRRARRVRVSAGGIGEAHVHGALGDLFGAGFRSGGAGDGKRVGGAGAAARAQGHGFGGLLAHGAVLLEDLRGTPSNSIFMALL